MAKKVFIGLSGGVDSSVSAALLKEAGYDVTGVFIRVWEPPKNLLPTGCNWRDDRRDAMKVCATLEIPFQTLDLSAEYKREVVDYMISEYQAGRTPNPDVMCNRQIKFGGFYDWAIKEGADYVATGHYTQIIKNKEGVNELHMAIDQNKDQSYFLWTLKPEQLNHILFPIGHLEKPAVRELAAKYNLVTATKKDSQGLCFVGQIDAKEFLKAFIAEKPGNVINESGEVIGTHAGIYFYTLGERHGFTITQKTPADKPYYVVGKNIEKNELIVSTDKSRAFSQSKSGQLIKTVWREEIEENRIYQIRSRYREALKEAKLKKTTPDWQIDLLSGKEPLTPGQSVVVYDGTKCLGGGILA